MATELMAHQREGIDFLTQGRNGLLAFEQGLGKTLVAIDAFRRVFAEGQAQTLIVICPNSLKRNWVAEFEKFAPEFVVAIAEGTPRQRKLIFAKTKAPVVITSYETARTEVTALLAFVQRNRTVLVLDESHAAKNWKSLTSTVARQIAPFCNYRWLLSGTPVTNTAADLFTQIEILAPGEHALGSQETFLAMMDQYPKAEFAREVFDKLILRRTKEDCLDLPEKVFVDVRVDLPAWQRKLYDEMRTRMVCDIQAMSGEEYRVFASTALAQLTRLIQIASNPSLVFPGTVDTPGKFDALDGIIADILTMPSRKVIIWSNFVKSIEALLSRFEKYGAVAIYGGTANEERQQIAARFQAENAARVLIANPAAAGTGFTLTAATFSIYETLSWRYDHYAQSQDRNHRIGQTNQVTYMRLLAADTIEDAIVKALDRKSALARSILGDEDNVPGISQFTKEQMCELLLMNKIPDTVRS